MLVSQVVDNALFYGGIAVGVIGLVALIARHESRSRVAAARIAGRTRLREAARWLVPFAFVIGGPMTSTWIHESEHDVLVVTDDDRGQPVAVRKILLGDPTARYPIATELDDYRPDSLWVINLSTRPLRIETQSYGTLAIPEAPVAPYAIPIGMTLPVRSIDDIGPDAPPPATIEVEGFEASLGIGTRHWLTWNR